MSVELNKVYVKKENHKVKVKPFKVEGGIVSYSEVGYSDWKMMNEMIFLGKFELEEKEKEITYDEFMEALKARTEADLIVSKYNLQESKKLVNIIEKAKTIAHTFQNGGKTDSQCLTEAIEYLKSLNDIDN